MVDSGRVLALPGLSRLYRYVDGERRLVLPDARKAGLQASDGSRFGLMGYVRLRARRGDWPTVHRATAGLGLDHLLLGALSESAVGIDRRAAAGPLLERRLAESLDSRGVDLIELSVTGVDLVTAAGARRAAETRLLVIGLDGADWQLIDPLLEAGRMPNLRRLIVSGTRAKLRSITPMLSPVIWTSVATGVEPTRHGVLDFLVAAADSGTAQPVTSAQRQVPTVWELLSEVGVPVGVVGWWASWPADPVRGYLVSDRVAYQLFGYRADADDARGKTWPPDLYDTIRPWIVEPASVAEAEVEAYLAGGIRAAEIEGQDRERIDEFRTLLASGRTHLAIADGLRRRHPIQLEAVYFEGTDTVGHLFMPFRPPAQPGLEPRSVIAFAEMVDGYYETVDGFLGRLLQDRGPEWNVMILSDHGFASDRTRPRTTDPRIGHGPAADWHRRFGVLVLQGPAFRAGHRLDEATIYDIAPTLMALYDQPVPESWPGRVLGPALRPEFLEAHPVSYRSDDPVRGRATGALNVAGGVGEDLLEKLRTLGYVGGEGQGAEALSASNNTGVSLLAQGEFAEAERAFREAIELRPGAAVLQLNMGLALVGQGRLDEAVGWLERAKAQPATHRVASDQLAQLHLEQSRYAESERLLRTALELEPEASDLLNTLGLTLERQGRAEAAEQAFRRAASLDPDAALPRNNLGNLLEAAGRFDEAETWYLQAIEADPYFMGAYNNLALIYQRKGRVDRALDLYTRALIKAPQDAIVWNNLGSLHFDRGDHRRAAEAWDQARAADPGYVAPLNNLASLEILAGRGQAAIPLLEQALGLDPSYSDARVNLALVHRAAGRFDEARRQLTAALRDPRAAGPAGRQLGYLELQAGDPGAAIIALERVEALGLADEETRRALAEARRRQVRMKSSR